MPRSFGLANSYGVMQAQYAQDLLRDKTTSQIAWIGAFQVRSRHGRHRCRAADPFALLVLWHFLHGHHHWTRL